jgi:hypothetical protein
MRYLGYQDDAFEFSKYRSHMHDRFATITMMRDIGSDYWGLKLLPPDTGGRFAGNEQVGDSPW